MLLSSVSSILRPNRAVQANQPRRANGRVQVQPKAFWRPQSEPQPQLIPIPIPVEESGLGQSTPVPPRREGNGYDMFVSRNEVSSAKSEKEPTRHFESMGPLWVAVAGGKVDRLEKSLKTDLSGINEQDEHGFTPLAVAIRYGNDAMVRMLLKTGKADLSLPTVDGKTPLILAVQYSRMPILDQLLAHRAKLEFKAKDHLGRTAWDWAQAKFNKIAQKSLEQAEAAA